MTLSSAVRRFIARVAGLLLAAAASHQVGSAESQAPALVGARVRVTTAAAFAGDSLGGRRIVGVLTAVREGSVEILENDRGPLLVPLRSVARFEVSRGRKSRAGRGALIGALTGAAAGAVTGYLGCGDCGEGESFFAIDAAGAAALVGFVGAVVGTPIGAVIGSLFHTDRWSRVSPPAIRLGLLRSERIGAGIGMSIPLPLIR